MDESFEFVAFQNLKIEFDSVTEETLIAILNFITKNLESDISIEDKKNKLAEKKSIKCPSVDEVVILLQKRIQTDYKKCIKEKNAGKWDFKYFLILNNLNDKTLTVYNRLQPKKLEFGNIFYPLLSIRKHNESYFYWNHF